jgi:DNA-binding FadR family transcriptional regulator
MEHGPIALLTQGELNMARDEGAPYRRVLDGVLAAIRDGTYPPGGRLPPGSALGEQYGVTRSAAARAVARLRWIGLISGSGGGQLRVAEEPRRSRALALVDEAQRLRAEE